MKKILLIVTALLTVFFWAANVNAGPLLTSKNSLAEIITEVRLLIGDVDTIQKALAKIFKQPTNSAPIEEVLNYMNGFQAKLAALEGKIGSLKEIGKLKVADVLFLEIKLNTCNKIVDILSSDLSQTPPNIEHAKSIRVRVCKNALLAVSKEKCLKACHKPRPPFPIFLESVTPLYHRTYPLDFPNPIKAPVNGVYLAIIDHRIEKRFNLR